MRAFLKSYVVKGVLKLFAGVLAVASIQTSLADQFSLVPVPPSAEDANWVSGPTTAKLGDYAKITVPEGYRFADANGAALLLHRMGNPVPRNLMGLLAPDSGKWWVVLDSLDVGYLKNLNQGRRIDASVILQKIREGLVRENAARASRGVPPVSSIDWVKPPVYDASRHTLEWALRAETRTEEVVNLQQRIDTTAVVNHTVRLIGDRYVLGMTVVLPESMASQSIPWRQLVGNITFKPGQRYADYRAGEPLAKVSLNDLIIGAQPRAGMSLYARAGILAGAVVLVTGMIACVILLVRRRFRRLRMSRAFPGYSEHGGTLSPLFGNGKRRSANGVVRKRTFDYHRFYSDMMQEVSSGPLVPRPATNGKQRATAVETGVHTQLIESGLNQTLLRANLDLIANQNHLIEEQKRLLQEQARLLDEKSKLIHEKSKLLEKQSELLERDLL